MRLAVATHSYLGTVDLDKNFDLAGHQILDQGHHYGIALMDGGNSKLLSKNEDQKLKVYENRNGLHLCDTLRLKERCKYIHQIVFKNGGIYLANTDFNAICYQHLINGKSHSFTFGNTPVDINQPNSIFVLYCKVFVLLHNRGRQNSEIVCLSHSNENGFEYQNCYPLWHKGCHNIYLDHEVIVYNASSEGKFIRVDLSVHRVNNSIDFNGHTKGLSVTDQYYLIGVSEKTERNQRPRCKGYVAVINRNSFSVEKIVDLNSITYPQNIGNINEIRCISEPDYGQGISYITTSTRRSNTVKENNSFLEQLNTAASSMMHNKF